MRAFSMLSAACTFIVPCITRTIHRKLFLHMATTQVKSKQYSTRSSSIASLRKATTSVLSNEGYKNAVWAGLTGPMACGAQDESDEVDMLVVWDPAHKAGWQPHNDPIAPDLDDELEKALGRYVYVRDIVGGELKSLVPIEAILASRTLYGSEKDGLVAKLRKDARQTLENCISLFKDLCKKIEETRLLVGEKGFEELKASHEVRQTIRDRVNTILHGLDVQPQTNPLRVHLYEDLVKPVAEIRNDLEQKLAEPEADQPDSTYWQTIWEIVSSNAQNLKSLNGLRLFIQNLVLPELQYTLEKGDKVQRLAAEEDEPNPTYDDSPQSNDHQVPLPLLGIGTQTLGHGLGPV